MVANGDQCSSRTTCFEWHKHLAEGRTSACDDPEKGRPLTATSQEIVSKCKQLLTEDRRLTVEDLSDSEHLCWKRTFHHCGSPEDAANVFSLGSTASDMTGATKVDICNQLLLRYKRESNTFLDKIITVDESWMHHFEPETKFQSSVWKHSDSPPPKKALVQRSAGKVTYMVFFDRSGLVYDHTVPPHKH